MNLFLKGLKLIALRNFGRVLISLNLWRSIQKLVL